MSNTVEVHNNTCTLDIATSISNNNIDISKQECSNVVKIDSNLLNLEVNAPSISLNKIDIIESPQNIVDVNSGISFTVYANNIVGISDYIKNFLTNSIIGSSGIYVDHNINNIDIGISGIHVDQLDGVTANATELNYLDLYDSIGIAQANKAIVLDDNISISQINNISATGDVNIGGNLLVSGSTMIVNSTQVSFGDNVININTSGLPTGGFSVYDGTYNKYLLWVSSNNRWEFENEDVHTFGRFIGIIDGGTP